MRATLTLLSVISARRVVYGDRPMRETARRLAQAVDGADLMRMFASPGPQVPGGFHGHAWRPMSLAQQVGNMCH